MSNLYVEPGYVEPGYVEGDAAEISTAIIKKINFIVDNQSLSDDDLNALLLAKVGENYKNEISIIFGADLKIADMKNSVFGISKIAGGISKEVIDLINSNIENTNSQIDTVSQRVEEVAGLIPTVPTTEEIANSIVSNETLLASLSNTVVGKINVDIIAANGDVITTGLTYDDTNDVYTLDYDTSLLDGTNYTIQIKLS